MTASPIEHSTFAVERALPSSPKHAFRFWSERDLKQRWTDCHPDWTVLEDRFDFRIGGEETRRWRTAEGQELTFRAHYLDIMQGRRIIYAFAMTIKGETQSASLATVELMPAGSQTRMLFTEQIAFLGSPDAFGMRRAGTEAGFDRLIEAIAGHPAL